METLERSATRRALWAVVGLVALALMVGCGESDDEPSESTGASGSIPAEPEAGQFRMGIDAWIGYTPWRIAEENGYFEDEGLDVELVDFADFDAENAALASGDLDGQNTVTSTSLRMAESGVPLKIVQVLDISTAADGILATADIKSVEDLAGKTVGFARAESPEIVVLAALDKAGLSMDDIDAVDVPSDQAVPALLSGRIDAASTYEPFMSEGQRKDPNLNIVFRSGEAPGIVSDVLQVTDDVITERPGQLAALARVWDRGVEFLRSNKEEGIGIAREITGADPETLAPEFAGLDFLTPNSRLSSLRASS